MNKKLNKKQMDIIKFINNFVNKYYKVPINNEQHLKIVLVVFLHEYKEMQTNGKQKR